MLKQALRRFSSAHAAQLIRTDAVVGIEKVATQPRSFYELQEYQSGALQKYFEQNALLFPKEVIAEKS